MGTEVRAPRRSRVEVAPRRQRRRGSAGRRCATGTRRCSSRVALGRFASPSARAREADASRAFSPVRATPGYPSTVYLRARCDTAARTCPYRVGGSSHSRSHSCDIRSASCGLRLAAGISIGEDLLVMQRHRPAPRRVRRVPRERHVRAEPVRRLRWDGTGGQVLPFMRRLWPVPAAVVPSVRTRR
jgi:hypothetical protein